MGGQSLAPGMNDEKAVRAPCLRARKSDRGSSRALLAARIRYCLAPYCRNVFAYYRSEWHFALPGRKTSLSTERFTAKIFGALSNEPNHRGYPSFQHFRCRG